MTIGLETIVKGNMKRQGYVLSVDALALDDRMVELQQVMESLDHTVKTFGTDAKELMGADVLPAAKNGALEELLESNDELGDAIKSLECVFTDSMFFKSPAKVEELKKYQRRTTALINKINKFLDTNS